jgi:hypothetical protein
MYSYPVGRGVKRLTREQFLRLSTVNRLDPEIVRRDMAMMEAAQDEGVFLSFSNGWRDGRYAEDEFYRRYTRTNQTQRLKVTDKKYDGAWWSLNAGEIGCATPWNGLHTYGKPGTAREFVPLPQSTDWYGNLPWMQRNCARFGLRHFKHVPGEGHHTQPVEGCTSRSEYNPTKHTLTRWPLPIKRDEDAMQRMTVTEWGGPADPTFFTVVGDVVRVVSELTWNCLAASTGEPFLIWRPGLKEAFVLVGPPPTYPATFTGYKITATDFREHRP